jgi:class 3 adenylate cyclase
MPGTPGGTQLVYQIRLQPRGLLGALVIPLQVRILKRRFGKTFRHYDNLAFLRRTPADSPMIVPGVRRPFLAPQGQKRLEAATRRLAEQGLPAELTEKLATFILTADDMDLTHIRPYALADLWTVPRRDVLNLCLHATRSGVLDLQWDVLCPLCRGAQESNSTLRQIHPYTHCESCNVDFTVNFDRSVELTFRPNPAVREVAAREYCVGGPNVTPHILAQQVLAPGTAREMSLALEPGRYRVRATSLRGGQSFVVAMKGAEAIEFRASADGWPDDEPHVVLRPTLRLVNATEIEQPLLIERMAWTDQAATAAEVIALQVFRDLFSSEALRPGEQISVGTLAVAFTDLRESTQLYRQIGDAPAFGHVMNHFDILRRAIDAEGGALVKTIGDAVMAVFHRPLSSLQAILRAQKDLGELGALPLMLKAGIHTGPCIAVTLNERLDYFGSTVNLTARIQRFSEGGDIVISDAMRRDPEVSEFLGKSGSVRVESFASPLKGFDNECFQLWRVKPVASSSK